MQGVEQFSPAHALGVRLRRIRFQRSWNAAMAIAISEQRSAAAPLLERGPAAMSEKYFVT